MYIGKLTSIFALTAALGAASPALAASGPDDQTGLSTIGVDISRAGGSADSVQQFLAGLARDTQNLLLNGCQSAIANQAGYAANVIAFCETATGVGAPVASSALGFAPEEPVMSPFSVPSMEPNPGPTNY